MCLTSLVMRASGRPFSVREPAGQVDGGPDPTRQRLQPILDGGEQLADLRLRRVGPFRLGDQVDLAAVEPVGDDPDFDPVGVAKLRLHRLGGAVESGVLLGGGLAPVQQLELARRRRRRTPRIRG